QTGAGRVVQQVVDDGRLQAVAGALVRADRLDELAHGALGVAVAEDRRYRVDGVFTEHEPERAPVARDVVPPAFGRAHVGGKPARPESVRFGGTQEPVDLVTEARHDVEARAPLVPPAPERVASSPGPVFQTGANSSE